MKYKERFQYFTNICLNVTNDCNLSCEYCFVHQDKKYMTFDIAKKALDYVVNNFYILKEKKLDNRIHNIKITFFGGEPLLCWNDIIVPLVLYAEEKYKDVEIIFTLTTNGILLDKNKLSFLKYHNIPFILSCDGNEKASIKRVNKNGDNSFHILNKTIKTITEYAPETIMRATVSPETVTELFNSFLYSMENNFETISFVPNCRTSWNDNDIQILKNEIDKIFSFIYLAFKLKINTIDFIQLERAIWYLLIHDTQILNGYLEPTKVIRDPCNTCGLGAVTAAIDWEGKIYGCQEQVTNDKDNLFLIGDIYNGIDVEKHSKLLSFYLKFEELQCVDKELCKDCLLRQGCIDKPICPSMSYDIFKNFFLITKIDCLFQQYICENTLKLIHLLKNDEYFQGYLSQFFHSNIKINCNFNESYSLKDNLFNNYVYVLNKNNLDDYSKKIGFLDFEEIQKYLKNFSISKKTLLYGTYPVPLSSIQVKEV